MEQVVCPCCGHPLPYELLTVGCPCCSLTMDAVQKVLRDYGPERLEQEIQKNRRRWWATKRHYDGRVFNYTSQAHSVEPAGHDPLGHLLALIGDAAYFDQEPSDDPG